MQRFKPIGRVLVLGILGAVSVLSGWAARSDILHELESADKWIYTHLASQAVTIGAAFLLAGCALMVLLEAKRDSATRRAVASLAVAGMIGSAGLILSPFSLQGVRIIGELGPKGHAEKVQRPEPKLAVSESRPASHGGSTNGAAMVGGKEAAAPEEPEASSARCGCSPVKYEGLPSAHHHSEIDWESPKHGKFKPEPEEIFIEDEPEEESSRGVVVETSSSSSSSSSSSYASSTAEGQAAAAEARAEAAAASAEGEAMAAAARAEAEAAAAAARSEAYAGAGE